MRRKVFGDEEASPEVRITAWSFFPVEREEFRAQERRRERKWAGRDWRVVKLMVEHFI